MEKRAQPTPPPPVQKTAFAPQVIPRVATGALQVVTPLPKNLDIAIAVK